jgi:BolA protein
MRTSGPVQDTIQAKLTEAFRPSHLEVANESHKHNVPKGAESHFKVVVVSEVFEGKNLLERHRQIYGTLSQEMAAKKLHALAIHTFTPQEWEREQAARSSPPCLGGSSSSAV